jgi:hypothetical protein
VNISVKEKKEFNVVVWMSYLMPFVRWLSQNAFLFFGNQ